MTETSMPRIVTTITELRSAIAGGACCRPGTAG